VAHLFDAADQEAGTAGLHHLLQSTVPKPDHGSSAGQRFPSRQRAGFWYDRWHQQAAGSSQQTAFAAKRDRSYESTVATKQRANLLFEITKVGTIAKNLSSNKDRYIGHSRGLDREMYPFFRADPSEHQGKVALPIPS
jgi:hypothetical protein